MKFSDIGIILSAEQKQEGLVLLKILSKNYGICSGITRKPKRSSPNHAGDFVKFEKFARLTEQLGRISMENIKSFQNIILSKKENLYGFRSLSSIILNSFTDSEPHVNTFGSMLRFLETGYFSWLVYCNTEISILEDAGYGLDIGKCAGCGTKQHLAYLSPKSGRSVCAECSKGYENLLLKLPQFLLQRNQNTAGHASGHPLALTQDNGPVGAVAISLEPAAPYEILSCLELSEYFFKRYIWKESKYKEIIFYREDLKRTLINSTTQAI